MEPIKWKKLSANFVGLKKENVFLWNTGLTICLKQCHISVAMKTTFVCSRKGSHTLEKGLSFWSVCFKAGILPF